MLTSWIYPSMFSSHLNQVHIVRRLLKYEKTKAKLPPCNSKIFSMCLLCLKETNYQTNRKCFSVVPTCFLLSVTLPQKLFCYSDYMLEINFLLFAWESVHCVCGFHNNLFYVYFYVHMYISPYKGKKFPKWQH